MNRTLALFLTLAILVAHTLAIHQTLSGNFAPAYDDAHITYRVARNFIETGSFAWNQGGVAVESYPSNLWVAVAVLGERFNFIVTRFCQTVGAISAVVTILVLAQFSPGRLAGVIAPLLFVVSGGVAAAAASGAETSTLALLVIASFLAFERRAKWPFAICLSLCVVTHAEGVVFALMLLVLEIVGGLRSPEKPRSSLLSWFVPAGLTVGLMALARQHYFGTWLSPFAHSWFEQSSSRWMLGLSYLGDFVRGSGWTILLIFPLYYALRGHLTGVGRRALFLSIGYALSVASMGGGHGPMFQPMVPMTALLLIAIQESMTIALDSRRRIWPQTSWAMFLLALSLSAVVSKFPGDLGPLPIEATHRRWAKRSTPARLAYVEPLGRLGLVEEIDFTERLRCVGVFLRDQVDSRSRVLTPWPGALSYVSRLHVIDALGRATPPPDSSYPRPWNGEQSVDLLAVFDQSPDYIVPAILADGAPPSLRAIARGWLRALDVQPDDEARIAALCERLRPFEMITVPVPRIDFKSPRAPTRAFHLLRRRDLKLAPVLAVEPSGGGYRISVQHASHQQRVDLQVVLIDAEGREWSLEPNGTPSLGSRRLLRTSILLFNTGDRSIELARIALPEQPRFVELRAMLRNPMTLGDQPFSAASEPTVVPIAR
jgi:hypothetical protein